jgi:HPt (histidine-containing phosphotransfer) domain-containing protein
LPHNRSEVAAQAVQAEHASNTEAVMVFDREGLMNRIMGDEDLARTIVEAFLTDMPKQIEKLKANVAAGDSSLAWQQAHLIRGTAASFGGIALQRDANAMELAGKTGDLEMLRSLMPQLEDQFESLKKSLKKALLDLPQF